jgi:hypothetical protein
MPRLLSFKKQKKHAPGGGQPMRRLRGYSALVEAAQRPPSEQRRECHLLFLELVRRADDPFCPSRNTQRALDVADAER